MYKKLIFRNARKSAGDYLIYLVTMTICVTMFYAFLSVSSRFYHPDIGLSYDFTFLSSSMKIAVLSITLLLLFLIRYVNSYMLRCKKKEFALQAIMGMEQKTISWIFFGETFLMGIISILCGIFLGVFCSQFITARIMDSYGKSYKLTWTLFPDTVLLTICFFVLSLLFVGMFNIRTIRKIKLIDMLNADRENEPSIKKSRWMPCICLLFLCLILWELETGIQKVHFYYDSRFVLPVKLMFAANILFPALTVLGTVLWCVRRKKKIQTLVFSLMIFSLLNTLSAASVPVMAEIVENRYYLPWGIGIINQYRMFMSGNLLFFLCAMIYLFSYFLAARKEKSPEIRYKKENLFFFGQVISRLSTTYKTMTLISITLTVAICFFITAPILVGWASGYLDSRSMYDIQISSSYNDMMDEKIPSDNYELVTDFLKEHKIPTEYDCTISLYLPEKSQYHNRRKHDFPVVAISLSDYNYIRKMLGYTPVTLKENEFTT
ncbi:MAG: ABC transporter permease, partial [Eubacteriales bacterium]|nr:ABC transporter permease [Eubacteriales bacterium]